MLHSISSILKNVLNSVIAKCVELQRLSYQTSIIGFLTADDRRCSPKSWEGGGQDREGAEGFYVV